MSGSGVVRLRLLNGSNSTILRISFDGVDGFHQIATDGGFLEAPVPLSFVVLSPGERAEILVDFSRAAGAVGLVAQTNGDQSYRAMEFRPQTPAGSESGNNLRTAIPENLVRIDRLSASDADRTRRFIMDMRMGGRFTINGKEMNMNRIDERVKLGSTEIWEIQNGGGGMMGGMMNQPHSFHLHDVQFLILDINGKRPPSNLGGWKDTVLLWPGDRVRFITRFNDYTGLYMYHCHLLEHEDNGMMGQFLVK
ncbi:multicopper oxidase domain-containing protein [Roseovarius pacificus]|uniref:multicopper oxidase family protein n=1 Tax=Roseovarius pacificus TaxID=337701 RepID=UPI002A18A6BF|nr:multicopper oxidase domain-containing protein [Roseovarius pacificus]